MSNVYFNFFTIGSLIPALFAGLTGILFLTLKKKSAPTFWLGLFCLILSVFNLAYFWTAAFFTPATAFHRWITVSSVLFVEIFVAQLFLTYNLKYFQEEDEDRAAKYQKNAKVVFWVQLVIAILVSLFFFYSTIDAAKVYKFEGHYWDFDADDVSQIVARVIIVFAVVFIICGILSANKAEKINKRGIYLMTFAVGVVAIGPAIANLLSRAGTVSRDVFQILWDLCVVVGLFVFVVAYINYTKDKTKFMVKIVGISLVTLLLALQFISYYSLQDAEKSYNELRKSYTVRFVESNKRSEDSMYFAAFDGTTELFENRFTQEGVNVNFTVVKTEFQNTLIREKINKVDVSLDQESYIGQIKEILSGAPPHLEGFKTAILQFLDDSGYDTTQELALGLVDFLNSNKRNVLKNSRALAKLKPNADYKENLLKALNKKILEKDGKTDPFQPWAKAIAAYVENSIQGAVALKEEVAQFTVPFHLAGTRLYRHDETSPTAKYTAFMFADLENNKVYEVGFDYIAYRQYVHPTGMVLTIILGFVVVFVLVGFQFFFKGALVNPLNKLLDGVTEVNQGDLDVVIPVSVEDEIGYISKSFNAMVRSVKEANERLQEYAESLEEKVDERTAELQATLEEVQALKKQQDGDYFLTHLLIAPLGRITADSERVQVTESIEQKKKFQFRNWTKEIGGDLNMAHILHLKDKEYTFFMNADAMGKSMQGAGGILVLGSVLQSIIERTKMTKAAQDVYPERWLKNTFIELHNAFESFDGSMLISLVLALVDNNTGLLYFINAEHPWCVLYRDGKAEFIEDELLFRKLGTQGVAGNLTVQTFQMKPGDAIIAGSDGRDDILLGMENGVRIIREDETEFLTVLEEGEGSLQKTKEILQGHGELTDDFSLVRVSYMENMDPDIDALSPEAAELLRNAKTSIKKGDLSWAVRDLEECIKMEPHASEALKDMVKIHIKQKEFAQANPLLDKYNNLCPHDEEFIYLSSYSNKMVGKYGKAADLGERIRIRSPKNVKNLINLADIYLLMNLINRAEMMAEAAGLIDPENQQLERIRTAIAGRKTTEESARA